MQNDLGRPMFTNHCNRCIEAAKVKPMSRAAVPKSCKRELRTEWQPSSMMCSGLYIICKKLLHRMTKVFCISERINFTQLDSWGFLLLSFFLLSQLSACKISSRDRKKTSASHSWVFPLSFRLSLKIFSFFNYGYVWKNLSSNCAACAHRRMLSYSSISESWMLSVLTKEVKASCALRAALCLGQVLWGCFTKEREKKPCAI